MVLHYTFYRQNKVHHSMMNHLTTNAPASPGSVIYARQCLENINSIIEKDGAVGGLYIGDIISLLKPSLLVRNQIEAILSCVADQNYLSGFPGDKHSIPAHDTVDYPLNIHFSSCFQFIEQKRSEGKNVLVHCHGGVSRSAAIICAYLIKKNKWHTDQALLYIHSKRKRIRPNEGFLRLLRKYEEQILRIQTQLTAMPLQQSTNKRRKRRAESLSSLSSYDCLLSSCLTQKLCQLRNSENGDFDCRDLIQGRNLTVKTRMSMGQKLKGNVSSALKSTAETNRRSITALLSKQADKQNHRTGTQLLQTVVSGTHKVGDYDEQKPQKVRKKGKRFLNLLSYQQRQSGQQSSQHSKRKSHDYNVKMERKISQLGRRQCLRTPFNNLEPKSF